MSALDKETQIDAWLIGIAAGNRDMFAKLYEATKTSVYGFALSYVKNSHDAEDILHSTYVRIWSNAKLYKSSGKPMAWILTIAKNLALSKLRENQKSAKMAENIRDDAFDSIPGVEDSIVLKQALKILKDDELRIVALHAVTGLKHREIADIMDMPTATVLSKYSRAMKKLKSKLEEANIYDR